jgi:hypothetical protein
MAIDNVGWRFERQVKDMTGNTLTQGSERAPWATSPVHAYWQWKWVTISVGERGKRYL